MNRTLLLPLFLCLWGCNEIEHDENASSNNSPQKISKNMDNKTKQPGLTSSEAKPGKSGLVKDKEAAEQVDMNEEGVYIVPNEFPLKDGKLNKDNKGKKDKKDQDSGNKK